MCSKGKGISQCAFISKLLLSNAVEAAPHLEQQILLGGIRADGKWR